MQTLSRSPFTTVKTEGGILPAEPALRCCYRVMPNANTSARSTWL